MSNELQLAALAAEINTLHDSAQTAAMTAVQYAAKCGQKLIEAKEACQHGGWLNWLDANCRVKDSQAGKYMRIARELPELIENPNSHDRGNLKFGDINAAMRYLSASEDTQAKVDASPEPVTEKQIKTWEAEYKAAQEENAKTKQIAEEWRQQYLTERSAKRELENNPQTVTIPPDDYETTKRAAQSLAAELADAKAKAEKARQELEAIEKQKKKDVKAGIEKGLLSFDEEIKRKQDSIKWFEQREKEAKERYKAASVRATWLEIRQNAYKNAREHLTGLAVEISDAFDDGEIEPSERELWLKLANDMQNGYKILMQFLGG
jgi:chromosome segregation ATPase